MAAALFDTNGISDLMRDHPQVKVRVANHSGPLLTSVIAWGEIHYGLNRLPAGKKRTDLQIRAQALAAVLPGEPVTLLVAEKYGHLKAALEGQGLNLGDNDLWIASTALVFAAVLITRDRVFGNVPGLQVEDWTA
jgi:tRNA(fMet)-specific endonuclease VapC